MQSFSKYLLFFFLGISLSACSQKKEIMQNPNITANNIVEEITKRVNHYDYEPLYLINYNINNSYYELLINDIPVSNNFDKGYESLGTADEINPYILKKGDQTITINLYSIEETELGINSGVELELSCVNNKIKYSDTGQRNLFNYKSQPIKDKQSAIIKTSFKIENIPYQNIGWSESHDLRMMDKIELKKKVISYYKYIQEIIQKKDVDKVAQISYNKLIDQSVSQYLTRDEIQEMWEEFSTVINSEAIEFFPNDECELMFYGDGKLVGLKHSPIKNNKLRGTSGFICKYKENGKWKGFDFSYLLHIPKGKTEFEVY